MKLKQYIEKTAPGNKNINTNGATTTTAGDLEFAEANADTGSVVLYASTTNTNITFSDVGEWAYGSKFQNYVSEKSLGCLATNHFESR
jgi:hypothetical protein